MATSYENAEGETVQARHIVKYESDPFANFEAENNWIMLSYADVLLMMAEAIGPTGTATLKDGTTVNGWDLINEIRNRADLPDVQENSFFERLLRERRVELAFENHRWPDLKRFDEHYIEGIAQQRVNEESPAFDVPDSRFTLLFPIPQREVDVAGLQQN